MHDFPKLLMPPGPKHGSRRIAYATFAIALICASVAPALAPGGRAARASQDWWLSGCARDVRGTLSATPSTINRQTAQQITVTLNWSVSATPDDCPTIQEFYIVGPAVPLYSSVLSGESGMVMTNDVTTTQTFSLMMRATNSGVITLASTTVTVTGDPGIITLSTGGRVNAGDIANFDAQWMQPWLRNDLLYQFRGDLSAQLANQVWRISERMTALSRMYELTGAQRYIDHLHEITELAMNFRDDHNPQPQPDSFRGGTIPPGWGGAGPSSANLYGVGEVVSSMYGYPIAAFARIVAEDPGLQPVYGDDAIRYANELLKTVWLFMPQMYYNPDGNRFDGYLRYLHVLQDIPTNQQCDAAFDQVCMANCSAKCSSPNQTCSQQDVDYFKTEHDLCYENRADADAPLGYNENIAFAMMLIELWRTLDSPFYRQAANRSSDADPTRVLIPVLVSRIQHYFVHNLRQYGDRYSWHSREGGPCGTRCGPEDIHHGALDMRYIGVLRRNLDDLNAQATLWDEPIELDDARLRGFVGTFLEKIASEPNFAADVDGRNHSDGNNYFCDDWLSLSIANASVYQVCKEVSLREVNGSQPYLGIGAHSALLRDKWVEAPNAQVIVPDVFEMSAAVAANLIRAAGLVPKFTGANLTKAWVYSQSPAAGDLVAQGSTVTMVLHTGPLQ